ncbi:hypothetical protein ANN_16177 [Periplaneta americana]|uniref:Reverse transcriptase zinc-binding domain-containing protein n=1 Tax=Periplaneta americana TaxID=6978 RepID=A0ABQ8SJ10_PERAM|nr:hypothetical protein ANN_16177 [Periplaneta americana]
MSPGSSTESYPAFARIGLRENPGKNPQPGDNAGEVGPRSNTESYPAFANIGLRENPGKKPQPDDNASEMSPGSTTESYPAFARIGLRENPGKNLNQAKHQNSKWKESFKDPKLIPDLPRKSAVAMFRLITGHDCLSKHLHRIGVLNSPKCLLCTREDDMEMEHLANCETLRTFVDLPSKYWEARRMMTSLLNPEH